MKKEILLFLIILFILPSVLAIEITLSKNNYNARETLQAEITGSFISLDKENVLIYEQGKVHPEASLSGLVKRGDKYFYYATLPERAGNFSLRIENVQYIQSGKLIQEPISKPFTITTSNTSVLSINPGFIITEDEVSVRIMSHNGNMVVTATLDQETETVNLIDSIEEKVKFSVSEINTTQTTLTIGSYRIPVFILKLQEITIIEETAEIGILALDLQGTLEPGEDYTFELVLENIGNKNLSNIVLSSDLEVSIGPLVIETLNIGELVVVNVTLLEVQEGENISGEIIVEYEDKASILPIAFEIGGNNEIIVEVDEPIIDDEPIDNSETSLSCDDMGGDVCLDPLECEEATIASLDGPCCLGECIEKQGFSWWAIGLLILLLLGLFAMFFYKRMKKKQKPKESGEVLNDKTEQFKKRMGWNKGKEVNKQIGRS